MNVNLTFRVRFIHFSQLTPPPPRLSIPTSYFLAPYSASSRYRSQSLSPTRHVPPHPQCNEHVLPTLYSPTQCARRLLLPPASPHQPLRLHHGNRAISASYFARRHIGPTNVNSVRCALFSHSASVYVFSENLRHIANIFKNSLYRM